MKVKVIINIKMDMTSNNMAHQPTGLSLDKYLDNFTRYHQINVKKTSVEV